MIAFLMFFYFFIFVSMFVAITNKKEVSVVHIETRDLTHYPNYDSDDNNVEVVDDVENDEMEIDEGASFTDELDSDYSQAFQIEMRTKTKDEKILYEFHSYLSERDINEQTNIMTVEDDNIFWDVKYSSNVYEKFYDALIEYINENFLSENLVVYLNGEKIETEPINLIK